MSVRLKRKTEQHARTAVLGKLLMACGIGLTMLTALLFLASVLCLKNDAAAWILQIAAYSCAIISSFSAGFLAAKTVGKSGLLCGLLAGLVQCLFLLILCLALFGTVGSGFLIGTAAILFFGALGGITALNLRRKRRFR